MIRFSPKLNNRLLNALLMALEEGDKYPFPTLRIYGGPQEDEYHIVTLQLSTPAFSLAENGRCLANPIGHGVCEGGGRMARFTFNDKDGYPTIFGKVARREEGAVLCNDEGDLLFDYLEVVPGTHISISKYSFYFADYGY